MVDFTMKQTFPIATVIDAAQRKAQLEQQAYQYGQDQLLQGLNAVGTVGESLAARKQQMAQALAAAKAIGQTPEGKTLLGTNEVSNGPAGPVLQNQTATYDPSTGTVSPNKAAFNEKTLATALTGVSPKDLLSHLLPQYVNQSLVQTDSAGNIIRQSTVKAPKGSSVTVTKPTPERPPEKVKPIGKNPDTGEVITFDAVSGQNIDASGNPYSGRIIPMTEGSEELRRGALVQTGVTSINKVNEIIDKNPKVLNELKAIRMTPGRVYSQLASREAKELYINLREAIKNEMYLKTGATANPQELEDATVSYMAALNENPSDFRMRMDILKDQIKPFDQRGRSPEEAPESKDVLKVGGTFHGQKIVGVRLKKS